MSSRKYKVIFAAGADIKNRFLLAKGKNLLFGPDIGDLSDARNFGIFRRKVAGAIKNIKPDIIACDLHPGYFSTKFVKENGLKQAVSLKPVQHHHAHIASVMEEHNLTRPVIGVAFDGTGFGADENIWGGEFLAVEKHGFKRLAHLKYAKMPGGEKTVYEPWRMVLSILAGKGFPFIKNVKKEDKELILSMMSKDVNSPLTSSAGRLFDAAAALLGICEYASYEGEAPIKLEAMCREDISEGYEFGMSEENNCHIIDAEAIFLNMVKDLKKGTEKSAIATKFHNSIARLIVKTVGKLSRDTGLRDIALSGGVFQNRFLKKRVIKKLLALKFNVFINDKTPVNDFNISLGQYHVSCCAGKG